MVCALAHGGNLFNSVQFLAADKGRLPNSAVRRQQVGREEFGQYNNRVYLELHLGHATGRQHDLVTASRKVVGQRLAHAGRGAGDEGCCVGCCL